MEETRIIEIGGVKVEIDLRQAKVVEAYRVGQRVKVLQKSYGETYRVYPGVILTFDNFRELPTITIAYIESSYGSAELKLLYLNSKSADVEIVPMIDDEFLIDKQEFFDVFDRQIDKKQAEISELKAKRDYVIKRFGELFKTA